MYAGRKEKKITYSVGNRKKKKLWMYCENVTQ